MLAPEDADALAAAFGLDRALRLEGPVATGRLGEVWRLETDCGRYAVKRARPGCEEADPERSAGFQERCRAAGVPAPAAVRTVAGGLVADVAGSRLRAYGWVDVAGPDRRLEPVAVGRLLARAHRASDPTNEPVDGWYADPIGAPAWASLLDRLDAAGAPFAGRLAALVPGLVEAEALLTDPREVRWCHRDAWADNLRAVAGTDGRLVLLDWDNAGPADPGQELAMLAFEYGAGEPDRVAALVAAYEEAGGPGRIRGAGDFSMLLAVQGHLVVAGCERWLAAGSDAERAENEEWVAEFLDDPVTVTTVAGLLAAAEER